MSVPTQPLVTAQELAQERYTAAQALRDVVVASVVAEWLNVDPANIVGSFAGGVWQAMELLIRAGQRKVVEDADNYIVGALRAQNLAVQMPAAIVPTAFEGASDGRQLDRLVAQAVIDAKVRIATGAEPAQAIRDTGNAFVTQMASNQVMDAARTADQVALATVRPEEGAEFPEAPEKVPAEYASSAEPLKPLEFQEKPTPVAELPTSTKAAKLDRYGNPMGGRFGYIRMLSLPSCSRCALLAGRWYGWNAGFARHDLCDCRHIPCLVAGSEPMLTDPKAYFDSLSADDQKKYFGKAGRDAILAGGDIFQVVNATTRRGSVYVAGGKKYTREAATKRGIYGQAAKRRGQKAKPRLTPQQIFKDAGSNRDEAVRLLEEYGYIVT